METSIAIGSRNALSLPTMSLTRAQGESKQPGSSPGDVSGTSGLHEELTDLVAGARAVSIDIAEFEELDAATTRRELLPGVLETVDRTQKLLGDLVQCLDGEEEHEEFREAPGWAFARHIDRLMASPADAARVADIAFVARLELRSKRDELQRIEASDDNDLWQLIAIAGSSLRKVIKATTAVERALCEIEGKQPALAFRTEVNSSIAVRKIYTKTRRRLMERDRSESEVTDRLRTAATLLARLVGDDAYPLLRISDRVHLRSLHSRLLEWSRSKATDDSDGERLWRDVCGFAELLGEISRREELVVHDSELARSLVEDLSDLPGQAPLSKVQEARLRYLYGRSEQIDQLIEKSGSATASQALEALHSIPLTPESAGEF